MLDIRAALPGEVEAIAEVRAAAWPGEAVRPDYMLRCVESAEHAVLVAEADGRIVGFVDGFMTTAPDGTQRWEIDLLAVHPGYQGRGMGAALVKAAYESGRRRGADRARALVHVENVGSQRTFARCGFVPQNSTSRLYVASPSDEGIDAGDADGLHLIAVQTFSYRGLWLEGRLNAAALKGGRAECARRSFDLAGAVIPLGQPEALGAAEQLRFEVIGDYEWWTR
jgi:ribosomal protein S18 acetylase RimI-like enzyme